MDQCINPPNSDIFSSELTKFTKSRLQGDDIGDGWTKHVCPHKDSKYFYNSDLMIVTTENIACRTLAAYRNIAAKFLPSESWVDSNEVKVVNHATKTLGGFTLGSCSERVEFADFY